MNSPDIGCRTRFFNCRQILHPLISTGTCGTHFWPTNARIPERYFLKKITKIMSKAMAIRNSSTPINPAFLNIFLIVLTFNYLFV